MPVLYDRISSKSRPIGGLIIEGVIGVFVGAVLVAVGYKLFNAWLENTPWSGRSRATERQRSSKLVDLTVTWRCEIG
jgi:hypothetical protein